MSAVIVAIPQNQIFLARSTKEHLSDSLKPPPLAENERVYVTAFVSVYTLLCEESKALSLEYKSKIKYSYPNPTINYLLGYSTPPPYAVSLVLETAAGVSPPEYQQAIVGDTKYLRVVIEIEEIITLKFVPEGEGIEKAILK